MGISFRHSAGFGKTLAIKGSENVKRNSYMWLRSTSSEMMKI